ncbi:MAG: carboxypeptidase-like regulatory domain-containing protein [Myxococcales bacterium]|nr:carboxypeptidase-like regulatory domain-containing protein [Myxococcales bacterium]
MTGAAAIGERVDVLGALIVVAAAVACGGSSTPPRARDGGRPDPPVLIDPPVAFEGHERFVAEIRGAAEELTGASVTVETGPRSSLEILDVQCDAVRCGLLARVHDRRPNLGKPVPAPIDGQTEVLLVTTARGTVHRGLLTVLPLDALRLAGGAANATGGGLQMASSVDVASGTSLRAREDSRPLRWLLFGPTRIAGAIDVLASGSQGRAGGRGGGGPGSDAAGPGGGRGDRAGGGGGGGNAAPGENGSGAAGEEGAGAAGGERRAPCATDFEADDCGGGGGGGAAGHGGAGGGTVVLASLQPIDLSGGRIVATGSGGLDGGGGGAGGNVVLAAPSIAWPELIDVAGGEGGTSGAVRGGRGGGGFLRVDVPGVVPLAGVVRGPAVRVDALDALTSAERMRLEGVAEPGATVVAERIDGSGRVEATAADDGAFTLEFALVPGLNRVRVRSAGPSGPMQSLTGTSFELVVREGRTVPVGGLLDCVRLAEGS